MAQLVERSLPTPEIRGSNPVVSKSSLLSTVLKNSIEKTKIKELETVNGPILIKSDFRKNKNICRGKFVIE